MATPGSTCCAARGGRDRIGGVLYHFSEDPAISRFVPHVPVTNPTQPPSVWAIDAEHAPLYWFPRDCPRVTVWPKNAGEEASFRETLHTTSRRVHAIELGWLAQMRTATLYRYGFDAADFTRWTDATGQWISDHAVEPVEVLPVGDLLDAHVDAGIELRAVPSLWPLHDLVVGDRWEFSIVRMANAIPRG